jgi:hypothetical protein
MFPFVIDSPLLLAAGEQKLRKDRDMSEIMLFELTDAELDAVCGGSSLIEISGNKVNVGANVNANVLGNQGDNNQTNNNNNRR